MKESPLTALIGIDLAAKSENPTGWALLQDRLVRTCLLHKDQEILELIDHNKPALIAIDAPFDFAKEGAFRIAEKKIKREGYRVFSPALPTMTKLTKRAMRLNKLIAEKRYKTIEVHPTSSRKALGMPLKDWDQIQAILTRMGLKGDIEMHALTRHEIDAVTAALTAHLLMHDEAAPIGDKEEGCIVLPRRQAWRRIRI
jgi:predicted nuclease with RNAse H fold